MGHVVLFHMFYVLCSMQVTREINGRANVLASSLMASLSLSDNPFQEAPPIGGDQRQAQLGNTTWEYLRESEEEREIREKKKKLSKPQKTQIITIEVIQAFTPIV